MLSNKEKGEFARELILGRLAYDNPVEDMGDGVTSVREMLKEYFWSEDWGPFPEE